MQFRALPGLRLPVLVTVLAGLASVAVRSTGASAGYEHQTWRTENGLPQNSVHSIVQTSDGYIWLATEGGLARFDGLQFTVFDSENTPELKNNNIRCLLAAAGKSLWIGTAQGLTLLQNGKFSVFTTEQGLPGNNILFMFQDARRTLWVITTAGTALYQDGRCSRNSEGSFRPSGISATALDRNGNVWMGGES